MDAAAWKRELRRRGEGRRGIGEGRGASGARRGAPAPRLRGGAAAVRVCAAAGALGAAARWGAFSRRHGAPRGAQNGALPLAATPNPVRRQHQHATLACSPGGRGAETRAGGVARPSARGATPHTLLPRPAPQVRARAPFPATAAAAARTRAPRRARGARGSKEGRARHPPTPPSPLPPASLQPLAACPPKRAPRHRRKRRNAPAGRAAGVLFSCRRWRQRRLPTRPLPPPRRRPKTRPCRLGRVECGGVAGEPPRARAPTARPPSQSMLDKGLAEGSPVSMKKGGRSGVVTAIVEEVTDDCAHPPKVGGCGEGSMSKRSAARARPPRRLLPPPPTPLLPLPFATPRFSTSTPTRTAS